MKEATKPALRGEEDYVRVELLRQRNCPQHIFGGSLLDLGCSGPSPKPPNSNPFFQGLSTPSAPTLNSPVGDHQLESGDRGSLGCVWVVVWKNTKNAGNHRIDPHRYEEDSCIFGTVGL